MNFIYIALAAEGETISKLTAGLNSIYRYSISIGGILAFGIIIFAGIEYIISAGNVSRQQNAKSRIFNAILGLVILLGAVLIIEGVPGLLSFSKIERPTPPISGSGGVLKPVINSEEEAKLADTIKQRVAAVGTSIPQLKALLEEIKNTYTNSYIRNKALAAYFSELQNQGQDAAVFNSLGNIAEKIAYLEMHRRADVNMVDIAYSLNKDDAYQIYKGLSVSGNPVDLLRQLKGVQLADLFINIYEDKDAKDADLETFLKSLNPNKMMQLYSSLGNDKAHLEPLLIFLRRINDPLIDLLKLR